MNCEMNLCEDKLNLLSKLKQLADTKSNEGQCGLCVNKYYCYLNLAGAFDIWGVCSRLCNGTLKDMEFWDCEIGSPFEEITKARFDKIVYRFANEN